jgi:site-specific recombinase XerD
MDNSLIRDFIVASGVENTYSQSTLNAFEFDLTLFFRFLVKDDFPDLPFDVLDTSGVDLALLKNLSTDELQVFLDYLVKERQNKPASIRRKINSLTAFFTWLKKNWLIDTNPTLELVKPPLQLKDPDVLSLSQVKSLLKHVDGEHAIRDLAILQLFLNLGLNISDVCNLSVTDYDRDNQTLAIRNRETGNQILDLNSLCLLALDDYMLLRDTLKGVDGNYLFLSARYTGLKRRSVYQIVKKHLAAADLDTTRYSPNTLRQTAAVLLLELDNDPDAVADYLGMSLHRLRVYRKSTTKSKISFPLDN